MKCVKFVLNFYNILLFFHLYIEVKSMNCYIYKIINNITNEVYVGQTTNFSRRIQDHLEKLRNNKHINPKLQASWNKYGEANFSISKEKFDLTKEELNQKEKDEIEKCNSYNNGFNLTIGGTGGNTRPRTLNFEQFCLAYFGNQKYTNVINRTAKALRCDSSIVSAINRKIAYDDYRQIADAMPQEEKDIIIKQFEILLDLKNNPPAKWTKKLSDEDIVKFLCFTTVFDRGAEALFLRHYGLSKGLGHHIKQGEYQNAQKLFKALSIDDIIDIAEEYYYNEEIQRYVKTPLKRKIY